MVDRARTRSGGGCSLGARGSARANGLPARDSRRARDSGTTLAARRAGPRPHGRARPAAHGRSDRGCASPCSHSQAERRGSRDARRGHRPGPTPIARRRRRFCSRSALGEPRSSPARRSSTCRRTRSRVPSIRRAPGTPSPPAIWLLAPPEPIRSKRHGRQTTWWARFSAEAARARVSRPPHAFRLVVAHFGGGGTRQAIGSDSLPESSTATTSASPFRRIRQSMTPGPGDTDGFPPGDWTSLIVVPLGNGPATNELAES